MATARQIKAGAAYVEVLLDKSPFLRGLRSLESDLRLVGQRLIAVGSAIFAGAGLFAASLLTATQQFVDTASELEDLSIQTGFASSTLAKLSYVAQQTGSDLATLKKAIIGQNKLLRQLEQGSQAAADMLAALGISAAQFRALGQEQRFALLVDRLARVEDVGLRAGLAMQVFGKAGFALAELIRGGARGLTSLLGDAESLGVLITDADISRGDELGDTLLKVRTAAAGLRDVLGASLVGLFLDLATATATALGQLAHLVNRNREVVVGSVKLLAALATVGAGVIALGAAFITASLGVRVLSQAILLPYTLLQTLAAVLTFLISPLGLLTIGVVAGAIAFLRYADAGQRMVTFLSTNLRELLNFSQRVFQGIARALFAGDVKLAAEILWSSLELAWLTGKDFLLRETQDLRLRFHEAVLDMMYGAHQAILQGWNSITKTFREFSRLVIDEFAVITNAAQRDFLEPVSRDLAKLFLWLTTPLGDNRALAQGEQSIEDTFNDRAREREDRFLAGVLAREERARSVTAAREQALREEIERLRTEAAQAKTILTETDQARLQQIEASIQAKSAELAQLLEQTDKLELGEGDKLDSQLREISVSGLWDDLGAGLRQTLTEAADEVKTLVAFSATEAGRTAGFLAGEKKNPNETLERLTTQQNQMLREQLTVFKNLEVAD